MSKFFIQMLLSMAVAASAAAGFNPTGKGEVNKTLKEVKAFAHEIARSIGEVGVKAETDAEVLVQVPLESLMKGEADAEVDAEAEPVPDKSPKKSESNKETSVSAQSESGADVDLSNIDLQLDNELESDLNLEMGIGD